MLPIKSLQMLMSNENLEVSSPSPSNQIDYRKHQGVQQTNSGKWGAAIRHPITKVSVWLGSYNTPKEAADAFIKKQLEFQSLAVHKIQDSGIQEAKIQDLGDNESMRLETSKTSIEETEMNFKESKTKVKEDVTAHSSAIRAKRLPGSGSIYQKKSGRWQARICYKKSKFHVGIYSTYEEAEAALNKKRQELNSVACVEASANELVNRDLMCSDQNPEKQVSIVRPCGEEDSAQVVSNTDVAVRVKRLPGSGSISRKGGKWQAQIYTRKSKFHVGLYTTYEEAEAAIHKERQDLDSVTHVEMVAEEDRTTTTSKESMACNQDPEKQICFIRPRGVYKRKSGRWFAEIKNPVTKWRGSVGTYDTAEQAFEVLNTKRREFALLKIAEKKRKQTIEVAKEDLHATITNCKVELIEWKGDETALATKSQDIECGDCRASMDDVQVPCSLFVSNEEFDTGVINAYGELVGEFSRLDDDLWLVESLDDVYVS